MSVENSLSTVQLWMWQEMSWKIDKFDNSITQITKVMFEEKKYVFSIYFTDKQLGNNTFCSGIRKSRILLYSVICNVME